MHEKDVEMSDRPIQPNSPVSLVEIPEHSINTKKHVYTRLIADNTKKSTREETVIAEDKSKQEVEQRQSVHKYASYAIYHPTGYAVVRIINAETGEVLAQYPPCAAMDKMTELEKQNTSFNEST